MISDIEASVLGLVCEGKRYGYEVEKLIKERRMRNWAEIAFSSIYYVLKKLEKKGLITSSIEEAKGRPSRRFYRVTEEGKKSMNEKIMHVLSNYQKLISPFDLGIGYMGLLKTEEALECLNLYLKSIDDEISSCERRLEHVDQSNWPYYIAAICTRPIAKLKAEKYWLKDFIDEVRECARKNLGGEV